MPVIAAHELRVRNTFIDVGPSPSMARFLRERMALSCPGSKVGQLANAFNQSSDTECESLSHSSKPQMISLMDALADAPTMPCTPEPLDCLWYPFARDIDVPRMPYTGGCLPDSAQPSLGATGTPAIMMPQHAGNVAVASDHQQMLLPHTGSDKLPSLGSFGHELGQCKPCAFLHTKGCSSGTMCKFCHLCDAGTKKRRQKEKKQTFKDETRSM